MVWQKLFELAGRMVAEASDHVAEGLQRGAGCGELGREGLQEPRE